MSSLSDDVCDHLDGDDPKNASSFRDNERAHWQQLPLRHRHQRYGRHAQIHGLRLCLSSCHGGEQLRLHQQPRWFLQLGGDYGVNHDLCGGRCCFDDDWVCDVCLQSDDDGRDRGCDHDHVPDNDHRGTLVSRLHGAIFDDLGCSPEDSPEDTLEDTLEDSQNTFCRVTFELSSVIRDSKEEFASRIQTSQKRLIVHINIISVLPADRSEILSLSHVFFFTIPWYHSPLTSLLVELWGLTWLYSPRIATIVRRKNNSHCKNARRRSSGRTFVRVATKMLVVEWSDTRS